MKVNDNGLSTKKPIMNRLGNKRIRIICSLKNLKMTENIFIISCRFSNLNNRSAWFFEFYCETITSVIQIHVAIQSSAEEK